VSERRARIFSVDAAVTHLAEDPSGPEAGGDDALAAFDMPRVRLEPCKPAELRALLLGGENDSDVCERVLAWAARAEGALDLATGEGLLAMTLGDRLVARGYSCLGDYAREALGLGERHAQTLVQLARELRARPLLGAAVRSGEVRIRAALTVLPVARGEAEALWVGRAREETVRSLEGAVREARVSSGEEEDEWVQLRTWLAEDERPVVDEALEIAGKLLPGSTRAQRIEAMAQEYLGAHPIEAGDDGAGRAGGSFRLERERREWREALEARLEAETDRWFFLEEAPGIPVPEAGFERLWTAAEIDARLRELGARRRAWDGLLGYCAWAVKRSGMWRVAGYASFEHYCRERLGLSPRTVERRAALERRLWDVPALREARERGLSYERLRVLARLPDREIAAWVAKAWGLTCLGLRAAVEAREEAQMRAARVLRARLPGRVAETLDAAFRAVREVEGGLLPDGSCLVRVARHFVETWKPYVKKLRTRSRKVRERDRGRCQVPGCSRLGTHAHHVQYRSWGGGDDDANLVSLCACHHLRGIHGGWMKVWGTAPDGLVWEAGGEIFTAGATAPPAPQAFAEVG
jgi:hypothetical protein